MGGGACRILINKVSYKTYCKCVIGVLDKVATSFNPYMHSRLSDIYHLLGTMKNFANVLPIKNFPSKENFIDLATRFETTLSSIEPRSL